MTDAGVERAPVPPAPSPADAARRRRALRRVVVWFGAALAVWAAKLFLVDVYGVREQSMWPTLRGDVDRVLVDKTAFVRGAPRRWDMVVFRREGKAFVKRVLSTGGERILLWNGDLFVGDDPSSSARPPRPPETTEAMRVPVYPGTGAVGPARFKPFGDGEVFEVDGALGIRAACGVFRAHLRGALGDDMGVRDDHPGADGKMHRGRDPVPDVRVVVGKLRRDPGARFSVVHRLKGERRSVDLAATGLTVRVEEDGGAVRLVTFSELADADGLEVETLDGFFVVRARTSNRDWREVWRDPRATERFGDYSALWFEVEGGAATLGDLAVTRDAHYVWRDGAGLTADPRTVPPGTLFLVGDNAPVSTDSRTFGPVGLDALVGRVTGVVWPRSR